MMKVFSIFIVTLFPLTSLSQIEVGKYLFCFKEYWTCHTQIKLELFENSLYEFTLQDDVQSKSSTGTWELTSNKLKLRPHAILDTFKVKLYQRRISKSIKKRYKDDFDVKIRGESVVAISQGNEPLVNTQVAVNSKTNRGFNTRESGFFLFKGNIPDSISFDIKNRNFIVFPKKEVGKKFLYDIRIFSNIKDPAISMTMNGEIPFDGQSLYMIVWNEEKGASERLIFRKME